MTLDVGPRIVRLCVHNAAGRGGRGRDGVAGRHGGQARAGAAGPRRGGTASDAARRPTESQGLGLRSLRQRARAVGGSLTTDTTNGFRLICVLPLSTPSDRAPGSAP